MHAERVRHNIPCRRDALQGLAVSFVVRPSRLHILLNSYWSHICDTIGPMETINHA
jgi:hypothetical protein